MQCEHRHSNPTFLRIQKQQVTRVNNGDDVVTMMVAITIMTVKTMMIMPIVITVLTVIINR